MNTPAPATAADIRAAIARKNLFYYHVAAVCRLHPSRLSHYLSGRVDIPPATASKLMEVIEAWPAEGILDVEVRSVRR